MNQLQNNLTHYRCRIAIGHHATATMILLFIQVFAVSEHSNADSTSSATVVFQNGVRAVRNETETNVISLGKAAFFQPFLRSLPSTKGERRKHAAINAVLIPRDETGKPNDSAAIKAQINRTATEDQLVFQNLGTLTLSADGIFAGQLRGGEKEFWNTGAYLEMTAVVFDQMHMKIGNHGLVDEINLPKSRLDEVEESSDPNSVKGLPFFFYHEWSPDWQEHPKIEEGQGVYAHFAVRQRFSILMLPTSLPYDPNTHPLRSNCPDVNEGTELTPLSIPISVYGGLEPYEIRTSELPPNLTLNPETMTISGLPNKAGRYNVAIEIKDAQFPAGDWEGARNAGGTLGEPYHSFLTTIEINGPLEAELLLPSYSRKGSEVKAACVAKGGAGRSRFEKVKLPLGIDIDRESGLIHGYPAAVGYFDVEIRVTSHSGADDNGGQTVTVKGKWRIIEPLVKPVIL